MSMQGFWADLKAPDFRDLPADAVAVLPVGAVEQHGPHLPLSVDRDLVEAVVERTLPRLAAGQSVLVLPTLAVSRSGEHDRHPGTLSLGAETLLAILRDIGGSVARAGVARLMMLNGHGGNTAILEVAVRELRMAHGLIAAHGSWFGFTESEGLFPLEALAEDIHAGDSETSAMLAARADLVDMSRARDFVPAMRGWAEASRFIGLSGQPARPGWVIDDLNADGACGDATSATREKGDALLDSAARNFAAFLEEFARFDHRAGPA